MSLVIGPLELDFLWEALHAGEPPYPLEIRSHGATLDERATLRRQVHERLRERGMLDMTGRLDARIEDWLAALAQPQQSIDLVFLPDLNTDPVRALAAVGPTGVAVLATQNSTQELTLRQIDRTGLISAIVDMLAPSPRGTEPSISLPAEEFALVGAPDARGRAGGPPEEPAYPGIDRRSATQGDGLSPHVEFDTVGAGRGPAPGGRASDVETRQALARLTGQPSLRGGQIAANIRSQLGGRRRSPVLAWFDNESGRYLGHVKAATDGRNWTTVAPADAATLRKRISELMATVTADGR